MKKCPKCEEVLEESFFAKNTGRSGKLQSYCKSCKRHLQNDWYKRNAERHKKNVGAQQDLYVKKIQTLKETTPCMDCKKYYPFYVMDFDHRYDKEFTIAGAIRIRGINKIMAEIEKCDIVCSNCHRERTHKRREEIKNCEVV